MNTQISEHVGHDPKQGAVQIDGYAAHEKVSAEIGQRLFDIFTNLSLPAMEIVSAYEAVSESFHSDKNLSRKDWLAACRTANAYLGAALSLEEDGGNAKQAEAREKAVELNAYFESQKACVSYCTSRGDLHWHHVIHSCVSSFMVFYGWAGIDEERVTPEAEAIILEAWDQLGIPRHHWESEEDWTNDEDALAGVLGEDLTEDGREWSSKFENETEVEGRPGIYTGTHVSTYIGGYTDTPISPIEVRDIVRAAFKEIFELEYLSRSGRNGNSGKAEWRRERINALVESKAISERRVAEIRHEILHSYKPIEAKGPYTDPSILFRTQEDDEDFDPPF